MNIKRMGARACALLTAVLLLSSMAVPAFALGSWDIVDLTSVGFSDSTRGWMTAKWDRFSGSSWSYNGLALSTDDGGKTWRPRLSPSEPSFTGFTAGSFLSPDRAFLLGSGSNAVWSTVDGTTKKSALPKPSAGALDPTDLVFTTPLDGWVVGGRYLDGSWATIHRTSDGGATWQLQFEGPKYSEDGPNPAPTTYARFEQISFAPGTNAAMVVGNETRSGMTTPLVRRTSDAKNASAWTTETLPAAGAPGTGVHVYGVAFCSSSHQWVVGQYSVVYHRTSSGWTVVKACDTKARTLRAVDAPDATHVVAVGDAGTLLRSADGGATWVSGNLGSEDLLAVDFVDAKRGWVTGRKKTLWYTTDGGAHWTKWSPMRRLSGTDRYATSVATSKDAFKAGASQGVVLAYGKGYQDALMGSGLAGALKGPLLLSPATGPTTAVKNEIKRVLGTAGPSKKVYVLGVLPSSIEGPLKSLGYTVKGLHGKNSRGANDYFQTAKLVATEIKTIKGAAPSTAFVARSDSYADALSASAIAAAQGFPVLLTPSTSLSSAVSQTITGIGIKNVVIVGGTGVVSSGVESSLGGLKVGSTNVKVVRTYGANRWTTATAVADYGASKGWVGRNVTGVAYGKNFPDALGAGVALGAEGGVLLLTDLGTLPSGTAAYLDANGGGVFRMSVFGGTGVVSSTIYTTIGGKL